MSYSLAIPQLNIFILKPFLPHTIKLNPYSTKNASLSWNGSRAEGRSLCPSFLFMYLWAFIFSTNMPILPTHLDGIQSQIILLTECFGVGVMHSCWTAFLIHLQPYFMPSLPNRENSVLTLHITLPHYRIVRQLWASASLIFSAFTSETKNGFLLNSNV